MCIITNSKLFIDITYSFSNIIQLFTFTEVNTMV